MSAVSDFHKIFVEKSEIDRQNDFCERVKELLFIRYGKSPAACVRVYGCQQNVSDGQKIEGMLKKMGFTFCEDTDDADLVLFNTCAVREHAEDRVFGNVGALKHFKERRKNRIVALCGCMVQQPQVAEKIKKSYPHVDLLFGTHVLHKLPELMYELLSKEKRVFDITGDSGVIAEGIETRRTGVKGWLPVMYGCNNFCTYCIVPYVRGRERSREPEAIIDEAREMIRQGYKEITLLGQNVNSYGKTLESPLSFAELIKRINALNGDFIIRFMTSHPKDCTEELLAAMRNCEKVAPHLHLPVQSGSNSILKAMNRVYTREDYIELVQKAREYVPEICLTSDIIVGFPGETREDFEQTLSLVQEVGYSSLFTFVYSPREGTPAAKLADPVSAAEKSRWLAELACLQEKISAQRNALTVGKTFRALCEGEAKKSGFLNGRTGGNINIEFEGNTDLINSFVNVTVTEALSYVLKGKIN